MRFWGISALLLPFTALCIGYYYYEGLSADSGTADKDCKRGEDGTFPKDTPAECFFSSSYVEARKKFRSLAKAANADMYEYAVIDDLTTDVAVLSGQDSTRRIFHFSGVHGQEGYAGSAIQCAALNYYANFDSPPNVTIVFVHAGNI